jgi:RimJ/RimL family protein N-acetyltransferase
MSPASIPVALLAADDPAWESWLEPIHRDVYHTAGYHLYAQGAGEGDPRLIVVGDRRRGVAWPYLLRRVGDVPGLGFSSATDVHSVYGYPGPLSWGCEGEDEFVDRAWTEIQAVWREEGAVAAFTRFHPLLGNAELARHFHAHPGADEQPDPVIPGGWTVSVDLTIGYEAARAAFARDIRREVDQSRRAGLTTVVDDDWTELPAFARLYNDTMTRLGASEFYFFKMEDFQRLRDSLPGHVHLLVTRADDAVASAGLFMDWGEIVEWYLVGTDIAFQALSPSKVLVDFAISWAHERGHRVLHLGGGRGGKDDSLFWFKSRFSPRRHEFHTGRWVLEPTTYRELLAARRSTPGNATPSDETFFPAYRAPMAVPAASGQERSAAAQEPMRTSRVGPADADDLASLLPRIDDTFFTPHPMTADEAARISMHRGRDVYLIGRVGNEAIAYGMLRGWDEGFEIPSLGIGVRRDREHQGYGRAMMYALHQAAREGSARKVRLRVHPNNTRAVALYRSMGYREIGMDREEILMLLLDL